MFEKTIAYFCAPALAGIKPANIVSCYKDKIPDIHKKIANLNAQLNKKDIYLVVLCECEKRALVMVYRRKLLLKYLETSEISNLLKEYGYKKYSDEEGYINRLKSRLEFDVFPHEIGAFLGYPAHDIYGFINHKNTGCLLTGEWKVYKDADGAKKLFARYGACRKAVMRRIEGGSSLEQIFCAAHS